MSHTIVVIVSKQLTGSIHFTKLNFAHQLVFIVTSFASRSRATFLSLGRHVRKIKMYSRDTMSSYEEFQSFLTPVSGTQAESTTTSKDSI
jgi:hypothetical protein